MNTRYISALGCFVFAAVLTSSATPAAAPDPMDRFEFLTGSFNCTSTSSKPYVETFTRPMAANWVRAIDVAGDGTFAGEHTIGYDKRSKSWSVVSIYPDGTVSVDRATTKTDMTTVYPPDMSATLTFTRLSNTSYKVEGRGSYRGDRFQFRDTCSKRV